MLRLSQSVDAALSPCITMLTKNAAYGKLFCFLFLFVFFCLFVCLVFLIHLLDEHFETIANEIGAFLTVLPLKSQQLDL